MEPDTTILAPLATALAEPAEPPDLDRLGNRVAEPSARIDGATYELLCYDRRHRGTC